VRSTLGPEHEVVALTSAVDALARFARGERFDVILCDVMMPVMTGIELYERVRSADAETAARMIFLTGGAFTPEAQAFLERDTIRHLEKPFDLAELRRLVRAELERERSLSS
jgi:CheY-like chemotaxis protein